MKIHYFCWIGTSFEQYKDVYASLGLVLVYDDLRTELLQQFIKKQSGDFTELSGNYGFTFDKRNRAFMPTSGSILILIRTSYLC